MDPVVLFQKLLDRGGPGNRMAALTDGPRREPFLPRVGDSLESCAEGFVFPYERYSDQAVPLLSGRGPSMLAAAAIISGVVVSPGS